MKNDAFERQIKNLFEHEEVALNTDELWSDIEDRVEGKKKKRRFFFWLFFGLGLLAAGSYLLSTTSGEKLVDESLPKLVEQENSREKPVSENKETEGLVLSAQDKEVAPATVEEQQTSISRKITGSTRVETKLPSGSQNTVLTDQRSLKSEEAVNKKGVKTAATKDLLLLPSLLAETLKGPPLEEDFGVMMHKKKRRSGMKGKKQKKRKRRKIRPRKSWSHAIDLYAGPDAAFRQVKKRSGSSGEILQQYRKEDEQSVGSFHLGLQYKMYHQSGWMLVGGLEYRQVNERFDLLEEKEETATTIGVVSVVVNAQQDTIRRNLGDKVVTSRTSLERIAYNHYRALNMTLGTGYSNRLGKWRFEWVGGLDINLGASMKGTIRNAAGDIIEVNTKSAYSLNQEIYRSQIGMGLWGSASFARSFSNGMTLFATPYLRQQLGSLTTGTYDLKHRHTTLGLKLGGRIYIIRSKKGRK